MLLAISGLEFHAQLAKRAAVKFEPRLIKTLPLTILAGASIIGASVFAQIEGSDRGVAPIDTSGVFEVTGIEVDVYAKSAEAARQRGWKEAQRLGWRMLWQKTHGGSSGPALGDGALDGIVSAVVVEDEQIGPNRYIARLGILFDRVRTASILGVAGNIRRSAPLLILPVQWSGGTPQSFEARTEWQKAWARFRTNNTSIDYVRPFGTGADPLLLNFGQTRRPGRKWWRALLDQYGAADVLIPQVTLERSYPGGPVVGRFSARYGPDARLLQTFALRVQSSAGIPAMMDEGVKRLDEIYQMALANGLLRPDTSLIIEQPLDEDELEDAEDGEEDSGKSDAPDGETTSDPEQATSSSSASSFSLQFDTPDVGSVGSVESSVRGIPGVKSASTTSLALGGVSVMRVSFDGDADMLRVALAARGFRVSGGGSSFRIRRGSAGAE